MPTNIWGNPTWIFFHTLVENIRQDKFNEMKPIVINILKDTCKYLPCPYCAEGATKILNQSYIQNIRNKEHLIEFVRQFHNIVNVKLNNKTYTIDEIKQLNYKQYNFTIVIDNLFKAFNVKYGVMKLMTYNMHRNEYLKRLKINLKNYNALKISQ